MSLIFSQESIFHLYRLGLVVNGKTGKKYKLSSEADINALIHYCDHSKDRAVKNQFEAFIASIDPDLLETMEQESIISPHVEVRNLH